MTTQDKFLAAVEIINSLPQNGTFQPSEDLLLKLYAYHKQAVEGPCKVPKPSIWDISSRTKWYAWSGLGDMPKEVAMEKYIEELTKVIETMSYNEKVSKFMSLIGPFYEVVSADEVDAHNEKKTSQGRGGDYFFPRTVLETLQGQKDVIQESIKKSSDMKLSEKRKEYNFSACCNVAENSAGISRADKSSELHSSAVQRNAINFFKTKSNKNPPFSSQKDILVLTLINLHNSLEEIVRKLDKLQVLAKTANVKLCETGDDNVKSDGWNLSFTGTAFALLWPLAVHLYMGGL